MTEPTNRPVVVDMFCGSGGESQGIDWAALTAGYMRELAEVSA